MKAAKTLALGALVMSLGGCALMREQIEGVSYPPDTPFLIGGVPYQVSAIKCFEIRSIAADGTLDCYDVEGKQSTPMTPVSDFRRKLAKEQFGLEWGSPAHQAFLINYFYKGGQESAARGLVNGVTVLRNQLSQAKLFRESQKKSVEIERKAAEWDTKEFQAAITGGPGALAEVKFLRMQWHMANAQFFLDQNNKLSNLMR